MKPRVTMDNGFFSFLPGLPARETKNAKMSNSSSWSQELEECCKRSAALNPTPLLQRNFVKADKSCTDVTLNGESLSSVGAIRVMQWNLLAQGLCQTSDSFILCPMEALDWQYRQHHLLEELLTYKSSVYCLQEVDHFSDLHSILVNLGYEGVFFPKPDSPCLYQEGNNGPDGCTMFWDTSHLKCISHKTFVLQRENGRRTNQVCIVCKFQVLVGPAEGRQFLCATTHLKAKKHHSDLRTQQGKNLEEILQKEAGDLPLVLCGDFNADPDEECVESMKRSQLNLLSAYTLLSPTGDEPAFTTWKVRGTRTSTEESSHTIDYLFFTREKFSCLQLLAMPNEDQLKPNFLPSYAYSSDHLSLVADLKLV